MVDQDDAPTEREKWEAGQQAQQYELSLRNRELNLREAEARARSEAPTEREKWVADQRSKQDELTLKQRELVLRETEARRARWWNPLVLAVFTAGLAGAGNVVANFYSNSQQRIADADKAKQTEKLESEKAEANLILELVKTGNPDRAAENLKFLVDTKLITSQTRRDDIEAYIKQRKEGQGVAVPTASSTPVVSPVNTALLVCSFENSDVRSIAAAIDKTLAGRKDLIERGLDSSLPWEFKADEAIKHVGIKNASLGLDIQLHLSAIEHGGVTLRVDTSASFVNSFLLRALPSDDLAKLTQQTIGNLSDKAASCVDARRQTYIITGQNITKVDRYAP
jgi:hypothetical protein